MGEKINSLSMAEAELGKRMNGELYNGYRVSVPQVERVVEVGCPRCECT